MIATTQDIQRNTILSNGVNVYRVVRIKRNDTGDDTAICRGMPGHGVNFATELRDIQKSGYEIVDTNI